jgi:predicted DCC family thiol-disulfide oxidoreductase YuxK
MTRGAILLFDGDCAFCSSSIRLIMRVIKKHPEIKPYQWIDLTNYGISKEECTKSIQFYKSESKRFSGAQAFAQFLILSNYPWKILGFTLELPLIKGISKLLYGVVARNRYRLPGGTPECKLKKTD